MNEKLTMTLISFVPYGLFSCVIKVIIRSLILQAAIFIGKQNKIKFCLSLLYSYYI